MARHGELHLLIGVILGVRSCWAYRDGLELPRPAGQDQRRSYSQQQKDAREAKLLHDALSTS